MDKKELGIFFKEKSRFFRGNLISLKISKNSLDQLKWAFVVSSAIKKNAVARNTVRRRMNEVAQEINPSIFKKFNIVVIFRLNDKKPPSFRALKDDMIRTLAICGALSK